MRVAAKREERDGFTTNIVNGQKLDNRDYWSERIGVEWRPSQFLRQLRSVRQLLQRHGGFVRGVRGRQSGLYAVAAQRQLPADRRRLLPPA
ncbi:MAG: hypothetical protein WDN69_14615 [Aliidongia sp.]